MSICSRKYSRVRKWSLGLTGGKDQIAVIRASGSISRVGGSFFEPNSGIIAEKFIEKIRKVRGMYVYIHFILCHFRFMCTNLSCFFFFQSQKGIRQLLSELIVLVVMFLLLTCKFLLILTTRHLTLTWIFDF